MPRGYGNEDESVYALVNQGGGKSVVARQKTQNSPKAAGQKYITGPHRNHQDNVANIFNPVNGYRDPRAGKFNEPKDHMKENRQRLRDASSINKLKKETDGQSPEGRHAYTHKLAVLVATHVPAHKCTVHTYPHMRLFSVQAQKVSRC